MTNINFLLTISIQCQEIRLWELTKWSSKRKCFDLLSNPLNLSMKEMYGDQFGEFVCGYWGFKGLRCFTTKMNEWINLSKDFTRNLCQWPAAKHVPSLIFSWFMDSKYTALPMIFFFIDVISSFNLFNSIESTWSPFGPSTASAWSCNALVESRIAKLNKE